MGKNIFKLSIVATAFLLSACTNQMESGMHLTGSSYLHKELDEERVNYQEQSRYVAIKTPGGETKYVQVNDNKAAMEGNLNEQSGPIVSEELSKSSDFLLPVKSAVITSVFGGRSLGGKDWHAGMDFAGGGGASHGDAIYSVADGEVVGTKNSSTGGGISAVVEHESTMFGKVRTVYYHMSKRLVERGAKVKKGQKIGEVGDTGHVTGVHLHFETQIYDPDKTYAPNNPKEFPADFRTISGGKGWDTKGNYRGEWTSINPGYFFKEFDTTVKSGKNVKQ